jgi:DNA-directed RNA polymerase
MKTTRKVRSKESPSLCTPSSLPRYSTTAMTWHDNASSRKEHTQGNPDPCHVDPSAIEVWKHEMQEALKRGDVYTSRLGMRTLAWDWVQSMKPVLSVHIENIRPKHVNIEGKPLIPQIAKETDSAQMDHLWLTALPIDTLCAITIMEVIRSQANEARSMGSKAGNLISKIGKAVEKEIKASDLVKKENKGLHPRHMNLRQLFVKRTRAEQYATQFHREIVNGSKRGVTHWPYEWRLDVRARVDPCQRLTVSVLRYCCRVFWKVQ